MLAKHIKTNEVAKSADLKKLGESMKNFSKLIKQTRNAFSDKDLNLAATSIAKMAILAGDKVKNDADMSGLPKENVAQIVKIADFAQNQLTSLASMDFDETHRQEVLKYLEPLAEMIDDLSSILSFAAIAYPPLVAVAAPLSEVNDALSAAVIAMKSLGEKTSKKGNANANHVSKQDLQNGLKQLQSEMPKKAQAEDIKVLAETMKNFSKSIKLAAFNPNLATLAGDRVKEVAEKINLPKDTEAQIIKIVDVAQNALKNLATSEKSDRVGMLKILKPIAEIVDDVNSILEICSYVYPPLAVVAVPFSEVNDALSYATLALEHLAQKAADTKATTDSNATTGDSTNVSKADISKGIKEAKAHLGNVSTADIESALKELMKHVHMSKSSLESAFSDMSMHVLAEKCNHNVSKADLKKALESAKGKLGNMSTEEVKNALRDFMDMLPMSVSSVDNILGELFAEKQAIKASTEMLL
jgi:hypothetical protein